MKGRAVFLHCPELISPFNEPAKDALFTGTSIAETQDEAFARGLRFEVVRAQTPAQAHEAVLSAPKGQPVLLLLDRVYISNKAARDFLKASRAAARPAALALKVNASVEYTLPLQDLLRHDALVVHDVLRVDGADLPAPLSDDPEAWMQALKAEAHPLEVEKREIVADVPLPTIGEGERRTLRYPVTSTVVVSITHWLHILWLNQIAFGIRWMDLLRRRPLWAVWRVMTTFSLNRHKLMDRMVATGRGCDVHPSASVSASILGDNVQIGANATVRNSIVGDGAIIEDHAVLLNTVVGQDCLITTNSFLVSDVIYPEATVGNFKLQVSLVGRGAYLNVWASFVDAKFVGHVRVNKGGALVSSERAFVGSVVGHRAKVAAKVLIQPGREIPNDAVVVMRPDEVIREVPDNLPANVPLVRDRGTLVPLGQESKQR